jgi:SAM-dependent methyltransferase
MDSNAWDERYAGSEYVWDVRPNQFVAQHLAGLEPGTAIDLGAGEGRNAVWLARQGWRVTAVDFSQTGLAKGRRLAEDHGTAAAIDFVHADAATYAPAEPVDLVLLAYLQVPVPQQEAIVGRAASWLRPGGTVFIIAHDRRNLVEGYGGPRSDEVCYDAERTSSWLAGRLDIATATVVPRTVDTPDGTRTALDTLVIARHVLGSG